MVSRFVCYNLTAKCQNAITLDVIGLFGRSKRHTKGNFEEKKNHEKTNSKEEKIRPNLLHHLTGENFYNVAVNFCSILVFSTMVFLIHIASSEILIGLKVSLYTTPYNQFHASSQSSAID